MGTMMKTHHTHLPVLAALLLMLCATAAWADGTLTHLSGAVSVQKADGKTLAGTVGAVVNVGDTVITGALGYVRMEMSDGGEMVLRPDSQLKVEKYQFAKEKPADDSFVFSMLKGGLRTVTGLIGKRGNKDAYSAQTPTATIGIRGTQYDMRVCQANCGSLADGTYLAVRFGAIQTSNAQGTLAVAAGQVAHVAAQRAPVMLPRDPGIGFTPPAVIPKLDEKKKVKAAETAAAAAPAPTTRAAQTTSPSGGTAQPAQPSESSQPAQSSQSSPSASGPECSVQ
jgi:FecR protein